MSGATQREHYTLPLVSQTEWKQKIAWGKTTPPKKSNITVHFCDGHPNYISAYQYMRKVEKNVLLSVSHPDLELGSSPKTSKASRSLMAKRRSRSLEPGKQKM